MNDNQLENTIIYDTPKPKRKRKARKTSDQKRDDHHQVSTVNNPSAIVPTFQEKDSASLSKCFELLDIEIRFNTRASCAEINENTSGWKRIQDRMEADLIERVANKFAYSTTRGNSPLRFGTERWRVALNAILHNREVDPFILWLNELVEHENWDMKPRLDSLLVDLFGCEDNAFTKWASRYMFIGAIQRAEKPGCRLREIPILIGKQALGKSALCRAIFPDDAGWYVEGISMTDSKKIQAEALQGAVLVELDELSGISRADIEHVKSFITRTDDGAIRLSYRRNPEPLPRRCVIVGTTNDKQCLPNDPTGNTRFVPIECKQGVNVEKYMTENRNQIWLEAMAEHACKELANLPRALMASQAEINDEFRDRDMLAEDLIESLPNQAMTLRAIMLHEGHHSELNSKRFASALRQHGWVSKVIRENGESIRKWVPPKNWNVSNPNEEPI